MRFWRIRIRGWEIHLCIGECAVCDSMCAKGSSCDGKHRCEKHLLAD